MIASSKFLNGIFKKKQGMLRKISNYYIKSPTISEPVCSDLEGTNENIIIASTQKGEIIALKEDLTRHWKFKISEKVEEMEEMFLDSKNSNSVNNSPSIMDINGDKKNEIIFGTELGHLYALDSKGKQLWVFKTKAAIRGGVAFANAANQKKYIITSSTDGYLYILNHEGNLLRKIKVGTPIESSPIILNNSIIVGTSDGSIRSYDIKGHLLWTIETEAKITAEPTIHRYSKNKSIILVGSTDNFMYCISNEGKLLWKYETGGSIYSKAIVEDIDEDGEKEVVFGSCDNKVHVITLNGIQKWTYETDFWIVGSPIIMDINNDNKKEIIVGSYDSNIYILASEGTYNIGYVPGVSGIVPQEGNYSDIPTHVPGTITGKRLMKLKMSGMIIGCCKLNNKAIVQTKEGIVTSLVYIEE